MGAMTSVSPLAAPGDPFARYLGAVCVVTGGLGFIGSTLALALGRAGAEVRVIDSLVPQHGGDRRNITEFTGAPPNLSSAGHGVDRPLNSSSAGGISILVGDIADEACTVPLLAGADFVFNVAGQVSHHESMVDPLRDLDINVRSQLVLLETIRRERPEAVVVHTSGRSTCRWTKHTPPTRATSTGWTSWRASSTTGCTAACTACAPSRCG
jgi:UDP-glucose 4-epimerase